jgi:hypothetical protein
MRATAGEPRPQSTEAYVVAKRFRDLSEIVESLKARTGNIAVTP